MSIVVGYPGRICLLGEHCDWAGGSSLAAPIPLGIRLEIEPGLSGIRARSTLHDAPLEGRWPIQGRVERNDDPLRFIGAAAHLLHSRGIPLEPAHLRFDSNLPAGRGFSSSAAFCLAVIDGLAQHSGTTFDAHTLADLAYEVEHEMLGIACGRLDPLACAAGTPVFLRWSDGRSPIEQLRPARALHLLIAVFSQPRDTPGILATLQAHMFAPADTDLRPDACMATRQALRIFDSQAQVGAKALVRGDVGALGEAMNLAQDAYETYLEPHLAPLSAPNLHRAVRNLRSAGAIGAKFSGAGGDGSVIALYETREGCELGYQQMESAGLDAWPLTLHPEHD